MFIERNNNRSKGPVESEKVANEYKQIKQLLKKANTKFNRLKVKTDNLTEQFDLRSEINGIELEVFYKKKV